MVINWCQHEKNASDYPDELWVIVGGPHNRKKESQEGACERHTKKYNQRWYEAAGLDETQGTQWLLDSGKSRKVDPPLSLKEELCSSYRPNLSPTRPMSDQ